MAGRVKRFWTSPYTKIVVLLIEIGVSLYLLTLAPLAMDQPTDLGVVGGALVIVLVILFWARKIEHYYHKLTKEQEDESSKDDTAGSSGSSDSSAGRVH